MSEQPLFFFFFSQDLTLECTDKKKKQKKRKEKRKKYNRKKKKRKKKETFLPRLATKKRNKKIKISSPTSDFTQSPRGPGASPFFLIFLIHHFKKLGLTRKGFVLILIHLKSCILSKSPTDNVVLINGVLYGMVFKPPECTCMLVFSQ